MSWTLRLRRSRALLGARFGPVSVLAIVTFVLVCIRAARTADLYWDTLQYHWPFAARLGGICDVDCFTMASTLEYRYQGFPKLWHWLQGMLWRVTGAPRYGDLLNIAMVGALCCYLRRRFGVPLAWSWLAFLAIPEIQIELTASYIDLPLNAALTLALMATLRVAIVPAADHRFDIAVAFAALALAANSKLQLAPIAALFWLAIMAAALRGRVAQPGRGRALPLVALMLAGLLALGPKLLLNLHEFGNPFYPIALQVGPVSLPGTEPMVSSNAVSDAIVRWPGPVRWLASVLEFKALGERPLPWTLAQGEVPQSSPAFRMGGFFVAYVLGLIAILVWSAGTSPRVRPALALFGAISVLCAFLPLSFESRYYSFWMLTLVATVLAVTHSPMFQARDQPTQCGVARAAVLIALVSVVSMTGGRYLSTSGANFAHLTAKANRAIDHVPDGSTLCILNRARDAVVYASSFHPGRHYRTRVLWEDEDDPACTIRLDVER